MSNNVRDREVQEELFAEIFARLTEQDIEQFYAHYQLWGLRRRLPLIETQIETLYEHLAENRRLIEALRPSPLAQAVLVRLQSSGVSDIDVLDLMLARGEDWLDKMMQRLDYCEQVQDFIQGNYTQWCIRSLEGAYDWIDTLLGSIQEGTIQREGAQPDSQATEELLLQKLRQDDEEAMLGMTLKAQTTPSLSQDVQAPELPVPGASEATAEAGPAGEEAIPFKADEASEAASSFTEDEGTITPPELLGWKDLEDLEAPLKPPVPWYSVNVTERGASSSTEQSKMDDWIKLLHVEAETSPALSSSVAERTPREEEPCSEALENGVAIIDEEMGEVSAEVGTAEAILLDTAEIEAQPLTQQKVGELAEESAEVQPLEERRVLEPMSPQPCEAMAEPESIEGISEVVAFEEEGELLAGSVERGAFEESEAEGISIESQGFEVVEERAEREALEASAEIATVEEGSGGEAPRELLGVEVIGQTSEGETLAEYAQVETFEAKTEGEEREEGAREEVSSAEAEPVVLAEGAEEEAVGNRDELLVIAESREAGIVEEEASPVVIEEGAEEEAIEEGAELTVIEESAAEETAEERIEEAVIEEGLKGGTVEESESGEPVGESEAVAGAPMFVGEAIVEKGASEEAIEETTALTMSRENDAEEALSVDLQEARIEPGERAESSLAAIGDVQQKISEDRSVEPSPNISHGRRKKKRKRSQRKERSGAEKAIFAEVDEWEEIDEEEAQDSDVARLPEGKVEEQAGERPAEAEKAAETYLEKESEEGQLAWYEYLDLEDSITSSAYPGNSEQISPEETASDEEIEQETYEYTIADALTREPTAPLPIANLQDLDRVPASSAPEIADRETVPLPLKEIRQAETQSGGPASRVVAAETVTGERHAKNGSEVASLTTTQVHSTPISPEPSVVSQAPEPPEKVGFWRRLFGRGKKK